MFHAKTGAAQTWLTENNQTLSGQNHLLHVMQIEPPQDERLAEGMRVSLLHRGFENLSSAAKTEKTCLCYLSTKANRMFGFLSWETGELPAIFMSPRIMRE
jgi:hypothetical protein